MKSRVTWSGLIRRRGPAIAEAMRALCEQRFLLAIPVLLAQADGISSELFGVGYFQHDKGQEKLGGLQEKVSGDLFLESVLETFQTKGILREHSSLVPAGAFNRHKVMHGLSIGYGTELNGLKAVSQLNFMSSVNRLKKDHLSRIETAVKLSAAQIL